MAASPLGVPSVAHLRLPVALKVHPTFHVSLIKSLSPPPWVMMIIDDHPAYTVRHLLDVLRWASGFQYSLTFLSVFPISLVGQQEASIWGGGRYCLGLWFVGALFRFLWVFSVCSLCCALRCVWQEAKLG